MKLTHNFEIDATNTDGCIGTLFAVILLDESDLAETSVEFYTAADEHSLCEYLMFAEQRSMNDFIIQRAGKLV